MEGTPAQVDPLPSTHDGGDFDPLPSTHDGFYKPFNTFDFNAIAEGEFEDKNAWWSYYLGTLATSYVLFNGVITLMGLAWAYLKTVTDGSNTGAVLHVAVYPPCTSWERRTTPRPTRATPSPWVSRRTTRRRAR